MGDFMIFSQLIYNPTLNNNIQNTTSTTLQQPDNKDNNNNNDNNIISSDGESAIQTLKRTIHQVDQDSLKFNSFNSLLKNINDDDFDMGTQYEIKKKKKRRRRQKKNKVKDNGSMDIDNNHPSSNLTRNNNNKSFNPHSLSSQSSSQPPIKPLSPLLQQHLIVYNAETRKSNVRGDSVIHKTHIKYNTFRTRPYSIPCFTRDNPKKYSRSLIYNIMFVESAGKCTYGHGIHGKRFDMLGRGVKTPKKYLIMVQMFSKMLVRFNLYPYQTILCSLIKIDKKRKDDDEMMEISPNIYAAPSQINLRHQISKSIDYRVVYMFLVVIIKNIIPFQIWGSFNNRQAINKCLYIYLYSNMLSIELASFTNLFNINEFIMNDIVYLKRFMWWMFEELVPSILANHFYITDISEHKRLVFYVKKDWSDLCNLQSNALQRYVYYVINPNVYSEHFDYRTCAIPRLRFIPKPTSLRPIVNLRASSGTLNLMGNDMELCYYKFNQSTQESLQDIYSVLNYETKFEKQYHLGCTVMGFSGIHRKLKEFKYQLYNKHQQNGYRKIYMVSIDINKCFDNLNQQKIFQIISKNIITFEYYQIYLFVLKFPRYTKRIQVGFPSQKAFQTYYDRLKKRNIRILDCYKKHLVYKNGLLNSLNEFIFRNLVIYGQDVMIQTRGIAQGSSISPYLCCLLLGHLENTYLLPRLNMNPQSINNMMRYMDDYLYITSIKSNADRFIDIFSRECVEIYGVKTNPMKISKYYPDDGTVDCGPGDHCGLVSLGDQKFISWCGQLINVKSLEVLYDYGRKYSRIIDTLTFTYDRSIHWMDNLLKFICRYIPYKIGEIYVDSIINSSTTIEMNIFRCFLYSAVMVHCWFVNFRGRGTSGGIVVDFEAKGHGLDTPDVAHQFAMNIRSCILKISENAYTIYRSNTNKHNYKLFLLALEFNWMALNAFKIMLGRKQSYYHLLMKRIDQLLRKPSYQNCQSRLSYLLSPCNYSDITLNLKY